MAISAKSDRSNWQFVTAEDLQLSPCLNVPDPHGVIFPANSAAFHSAPQIPLVVNVPTARRQQFSVGTDGESVNVARMTIQGSQDVAVGQVPDFYHVVFAA